MGVAAALRRRAIRPPAPLEPNPNDPAEVPPATVGPPLARPGDPNGIELDFSGPGGTPPPTIMRPAPWSGWPAEWWTPNWNNRVSELTDTAWTCLDLNSSLLSTMPPYLKGAADTLDSTWLLNPDPDIYSSWEEFAKQLWWDYQLGEVFVLATARYATGWPARFHVVPPWYVNVEMDGGRRYYSVGSLDVTADMCHIRYVSSVDDAHGHGPLEAGRARLIASEVYSRYAFGLATAGGIPPAILTHPDELSNEQAQELKSEWIAARLSQLGEPAVLTGGITFDTVQMTPADMALIELQNFTEARIAVMLGVPPFLVGLPTGGDSMTYSNVTSLFDYHWRAGLRPKAATVTAGLSEWLLPRGTTVEVNKDAYVQPDPKTRAETAAILHGITDPQGNPALTVEQIQEAENITTREGGPILG